MSSFRRALGVFSTVLSVLGMSAMLAGSYLLVMHQTPDDLQGYAPAKCTLTQVQGTNLGSGPEGCGYIATWRSSSGYTVLDTPFGAVPTEKEAVARAALYALNTEVDCMCNAFITQSYPNVLYASECNMWGPACFLDTRLVSHIQSASQSYIQLAEVLLSFSGATTLVCISIAVINCWCGRAIDACCSVGGCCGNGKGCCRKKDEDGENLPQHTQQRYSRMYGSDSGLV